VGGPSDARWQEPHRAVRKAKETTVNLTHTLKTGVATLALTFLFAGVAQAGSALHVRSEALNRQYAPLRALAIRSEALNKLYGLDTSTAGGTPAQALSALQARGEALNQRYQLGRYAVVRVDGGFDWADAGIGAASMLGVVLIAGALTIVIRRSRTIDTSFPSTT
jgi:hypothetical protein